MYTFDIKYNPAKLSIVRQYLRSFRINFKLLKESSLIYDDRKN